MLAAEFAEFETLLRKHSQVFSKKLTDEMVQGYWESLKDLSLATVRRCGDNHLRYSKFFPKPAELRPRDESPKSVKEDHAFKASLEHSVRNWDERLRLEPIGARWLLLEALVARFDATDDASSFVHAERMDWARSVCRRLLDESGMAYVGEDFNRRRIVCQLLGGDAARACIEAFKQTRIAA